MDIFQILTIVLLSVSTLILIYLAIKQYKSSNKSNLNKNDINEVVKNLLEYNKQDLKSDIELKLERYKSNINEILIKNNIELNDKLKKEQNDNFAKLTELERQINNSLNERVKGITDTMNKQIDLLNKNVKESMTDGFKSTSEAYENLIKKLTTIDNASKNITELSEEVVGLKNVLENNQNRGKFGEFSLERILFSVFGDTKDTYDIQFSLKDNQEINERPDAVIHLPKPANLLCIDSKFPFQDYNKIIEKDDEELRKEFAKAVKKHITDVSNKYIIKGITAQYAILYIPSDAVFGYINGVLYDVVEYARSKAVVLSSPSTLQPILASINAIKIEYKRAENYDLILKALNDLSKDFKKFGESWTKIEKNISATNNAASDFSKRVLLMDKKFNKISNVNQIEFIDDKSIK